jgi:hypothetical protein
MNERAIIYLEADEEIPGVIDRLRKEKSSQITLVVPKASIILQSVINLKLILRLSKELKKSIALVSHDPIGRNLASQVGIPAYDSVNAKIPILEPIGPKPSSDDILEINAGSDQDNPNPTETPAFPIHHFQDSSPEISEAAQMKDEPEDLMAGFVSEDVPDESEPITEEEIDQLKQSKLEPTVAIAETPVKAQAEMHKSQSINSNLNKKRKLGYLWAILAALIVVVVGFGLFYPKAIITAAVKGEQFDSSVDITVDPSQKQADLNGAIIPAQYGESMQEDSKKVTATGTKNVGQKASGTINFYNNYSTDPQQLPSGTRLSSGGKTFITSADITIPGATLSLNNGAVVTNPGQTTGKIEATDAGADYNVAPGRFTITDFSGSKQDKIYGQSMGALTGGSSKQITVVAQSDVDKAQDDLVNSLNDQAKQDLAKQMKGKILLDKAIDYQVVSAKPDTSVGSEADNFNLDVKVKAVGLAFDSASFRSAFLSKVNKQVPNDKELLVTDQDQISTEVKSFDPNQKQAVITGTISTKIGPKIDQNKLKAQVTGKTITKAKSLVANTNGIEDVKIQVKPNWLFGYLPLSSRQIEVNISYR